jgi:hypothetical protein
MDEVTIVARPDGERKDRIGLLPWPGPVDGIGLFLGWMDVYIDRQ